MSAMRALLPIVALATACASAPTYTLRGGAAHGVARSSRGAPAASASSAPDDDGAVERGVASFYSDSLAGNTTANGERYDPSARTAAHRTLRFGTRVRVTRADGRSVEVCVNDRGPFVRGRIIDLSRSAAEAIGMIRAGISEVTVRVIGHSGGRRCE